MNTLKRKWKIQTRFYILCMLLIALVTSLIIFNLGNEFENMETFNNILEPVTTKDISFTPTIANMAEDISFTSTPIEEFKPRYGFTDEDIYLLAQLLCGGKNMDGDGEYDIDFQEEINYYEVGKVLGVVMNRVCSEDFPDTVKEVVLQKGQFSPMPHNLKKEPSDIALQTVREWCEAYDRGDNFIQIIPECHLYFAGNGTINITRANY